MAGPFRRAAGLLDAGYARHPLDARTSWSLITYSYLASGLASQTAAQARARELWRAPIAAARAIAFDPSEAARWIRLAETLIDVNCLQAAAVISGHATTLAPGDPLARRNRIATLANLGQADAALALVEEVAPDPNDGWFSAVWAIVLQMSAREVSGRPGTELLDKALAAANDAVRTDPSQPWYRLVRGDLLARLGKEDLAGEDFEYLWRESRLDQVDGLGFATRAAIELRLGSDAIALSTQALELAAATTGDYSERFNRGAALVLDGDPQGLPYLDAAVRLAMTPFAIDQLHTRLGRLTAMLRSQGSALDLTGVARALGDRSAQIAADTRTPQTLIAAELGRAAGNEHYPPEVAELAALAAGPGPGMVRPGPR
jgi:tetratricopeptide (TPR) repeat protein